MPFKFEAIGLDADDTLWQNESFFRLTQERFAEMLQGYCEGEDLMARLLEAERRNLGHYGFGIKGFVLSMIETAIEVSEAQVPASVIGELLAIGQDMLQHLVELLDHAEEAVRELAESHPLVLITKGDLLHQERKLAASGLGDFFTGVEIVSEKTPAIYRQAFGRHGSGTDRAMMVGNSMKSDVRPAIDAGAWGIYVPHGLSWEIEHAEPPEGHPRYREIADLSGLVALIGQIES